MHPLRLAAISIVLLGTTFLASAPSTASAQTTDIEKLFMTLADEKADSAEAMRLFLAETPLKTIDANAFDTIADNLRVMKSKIGKVLDHELVETKKVGESVTIYKYLLKGDASVSVWTFIYYKPPRTSGTQLLHVAFQTDVLALDEITPATR